MEEDSVHLHKLMGETQFRFYKNMSSQLQYVWVLIWLKLQRQKVQRLLVEEKISRQEQRRWEDKLWENSLVVVAGKGLQAEIFQQNLQNKPVSREEIILQTVFTSQVI